jgi:hypothetical protein
MVPQIREELAEVCNGHGLDTAAFIGVNEAEFESAFMTRWKGSKAYLIDPYYPCYEFEWPRDPDEALAREAVAAYGDRCEFLKMESLQAAKTVPNELGFVYLDGLHDYQHISDDIAAWWPKVRAGGILAGHDYLWRMPGVVRAVNEFIARERLPVGLTSEADHYFSWWVQKPCESAG